jgi:hypothetical protein
MNRLEDSTSEPGENREKNFYRISINPGEGNGVQL